MNLSLINPYIRLAMESRIPSGHHIAQRIIYDYELIYLEEGRFNFVYNGKAYDCKAGDIIFICPGIAHSFRLDHGEISQPHIHFDITYRPYSEFIPISFKDLDKMSDAEREWIHKDYYSLYQHTPLLDIQNRSEFFEAFYNIVSGHADDLTKKSWMMKLIAMITNDNFPKLLQNDKQLNVANQIKDYIDAGNGMGMTLDHFSAIFFYDKFYLERKFKETFGINIIAYRNKKRMELAKDLLKIYPVSQISELLGYQSVYSFSRAYKSYYGHAPSKDKSEKGL